MKWHKEFYNIDKLLYEEEFDDAYIAFKAMVESCVADVSGNTLHYDEINVDQLIKQIEQFPIKYRMNLFRKIINTFSSTDYEYDLIKLRSRMRFTYIVAVWKTKQMFSLKYLMNAVGYNVYTTALALLLLLFVVALSFTSTPIGSHQFFVFKALSLSTCEIWNAFLNSIIFIFLEIDETSLCPKSMAGVIFMLIIKVLFVLVFVNFAWARISDKMKEYDVF